MLILTRSEIQGLLDLDECIEAVEAAFRLQSFGKALAGIRYPIAAADGVFHLTAGGLPSTLSVKLNGQFPPATSAGSRRLTGAILVFDAKTGEPLGLLDSLTVTLLRTAALTTLAIKYLARTGARRALIVGAGRQAHGQVEALRKAQPFEQVVVFDRHPDRAEELAAFARSLGFTARSSQDLSSAARQSDVIVTITPSSEPILSSSDVLPGTLIVAFGADGPGKQELDPLILQRARVIVDVAEQAKQFGEFGRAIEQGLLGEGDFAAEFCDVLTGVRSGRERPEDIVVLDSTGTGIQDAAAAGRIIDKARMLRLGREIPLAG